MVSQKLNNQRKRVMSTGKLACLFNLTAFTLSRFETSLVFTKICGGIGAFFAFILALEVRAYRLMKSNMLGAREEKDTLASRK